MSYKSEGALKGISHRTHDGTGLRVGIVHTKWNIEVVSAIVDGAKKRLQMSGVQDIIIWDIPGSYELPYSCNRMIQTQNVDVILAIGCLIKGETMHFEYISEAVSQGLMRLNLGTDVPVLFGVLECMNEEQARARAGLTEGGHNHGIEWAQSAIEMGLLKKRTSKSALANWGMNLLAIGLTLSLYYVIKLVNKQ